MYHPSRIEIKSKVGMVNLYFLNDRKRSEANNYFIRIIDKCHPILVCVDTKDNIIQLNNVIYNYPLTNIDIVSLFKQGYSQEDIKKVKPGVIRTYQFDLSCLFDDSSGWIALIMFNNNIIGYAYGLLSTLESFEIHPWYKNKGLSKHLALYILSNLAFQGICQLRILGLGSIDNR